MQRDDTTGEADGDVRRVVAAVADTLRSARTLIAELHVDLKHVTPSATATPRDGNRAVGAVLNGEELYGRLTKIARQAESISANMQLVVEHAKRALADAESTARAPRAATPDVQQALDDSQGEGRVWIDIAQLSPTDYRQRALTIGNDRCLVRVWRSADVLFEPEPGRAEREELTDRGKTRVDSAIAPYLEGISTGIVIVEGYAQHGTGREQYLRSHSRASIVRDYLIRRFYLDPSKVGAMPLGADSAGSSGASQWDGVALAVILPTAAPPSLRPLR